MLRKVLRNLYFMAMSLETLYRCLRARLKFNPTWRIRGTFHVVRPNCFHQQPRISIGNNFQANAKCPANTFGIIQPNMLNLGVGAVLEIGDDTGMSGSTISCSKSIVIGKRVLIGTGCIIADHDAHPVLPEERNCPEKTGHKPVVIGDDVFIGARSIVLKGVTIGNGCMVGAGSVVTKSFPPRSLIAGNPARIIKQLPFVGNGKEL